MKTNKQNIQEEPLKTDGDISAFLAGFKELSQKHNILIGGCGCCGSPYLYPWEARPTSEAIFAENLRFSETHGAYTVDTNINRNVDECGQ